MNDLQHRTAPIGCIGLITIGAALAIWLADRRPTTSAQTVEPTPPAWVVLDEQRYPCPDGLVRRYEQLETGVWGSSCEAK